jgi:hypothetical protein
MEPLQFTSAHYIKLGRGGEYVADSFQNSRLRFGWRNQSVEDICSGKWKKIGRQLLKGNKGKLGPAMADLNALRRIVEAGTDEVWVTFHEAKLWWTRTIGTEVIQDEVSKYRDTLPWSDKSVDGKRLLIVNDLPGKIAKLQAFRATTCRVKEVELLQRLLNGARSPLAIDISRKQTALAESLTEAIKELHWKDFETLVDLVFRHAGWIRVSVLGQQAKGYDLELREPITSERYVVQVKSKAGLKDLKETIQNFSRRDYKRVFFVVHSPEPSLSNAFNLPAHVELVPPDRLGKLALDAGLADWLEDKVA